MKSNRLKTSRVSMHVSFVLIFLVLLSLIAPVCVVAAGAAPDITVKLNGNEVAYDHDITVKDRDKLEIIADFKSMDKGDTYEVALPAIFLNLNEEIIKESNKDILQYVELTILKDPITGKQTVKIEFLEKVDAASFSFWAMLDVHNGDYDEKHEIIIDGDMIISIYPPQPPPNPPGGYVGPQSPPPKVPDEDVNLKKNVKNVISEKEFLEDTNIGNALYYNLGLNLGQLDRVLNGTMKDVLPDGMKLFIPSAPGCGKDSYEYAFASFSIYFVETMIKGTGDDNCYLEISELSGAANKYVGYVNAIEISQGRSGAYTADDLAPTVKIPSYMAETIKNADGKYVTYGGAALGYRIDEDGIIHTSMLDKAHDDLYEKTHTGPWTNTSLYIPMYNTPDCETGIYYENRVYRQIALQSAGNFNESALREYLGATVDGTKTSYRWSYRYNGVEEFVLVVTNDSLTDIDSFEIEMKGTTDSFSFGKGLQIYPRIYFDQTKWTIPPTGEIVFKNTVTYDYWEKSTDTKYVYDFGSCGTVVAGAGKTVDGDKTNHLNPDADSTIQKYELTFKKLGTEKIPAGNFEVFDILEENLVFLNESLKIYKEEANDEWIDIADPNQNSATSATTTTTDGINLKAYYDSGSHRIIIVNVGKMSFTGRIKIVFKTDLSPDIEYGTKIINRFGETVETFVDHKIAIYKTDSDGYRILSGPATFSIQYTTESDFEMGELHDLTDNHGNPFHSLSTGITGIAQALYRIDDDIFYLKIQELTAPDGYEKLLKPIWIKAVRNLATQKMTYSLAREIDGISLFVNSQGLVALHVENTKIPPPDPEPTEISLEATKVTQGKELIGGQFKFAVYENEELVATATNTAAGKIIFTPISYTEPGRHTYTIKEILENSENWTMDDREFTVDVEVTDDGDGILTAKAVYPEEGVTFINKYTPPTDPTEKKVSLRLSKKLTDSQGHVGGTGKKFVLRLYNSSMELINRFTITANGDEVVIKGLSGDTIYYLSEEKHSGFELLGYEIVGGESTTSGTIRFKTPPVESDSVEIKIIVKNRVVDSEEIVEGKPSQSGPDNTDNANLPKTANDNNWLLAARLFVSSLGIAWFSMKRRKRITNT